MFDSMPHQNSYLPVVQGSISRAQGRKMLKQLRGIEKSMYQARYNLSPFGRDFNPKEQRFFLVCLGVSFGAFYASRIGGFQFRPGVVLFVALALGLCIAGIDGMYVKRPKSWIAVLNQKLDAYEPLNHAAAALFKLQMQEPLIAYDYVYALKCWLSVESETVSVTAGLRKPSPDMAAYFNASTQTINQGGNHD